MNSLHHYISGRHASQVSMESLEMVIVKLLVTTISPLTVICRLLSLFSFWRPCFALFNTNL
jgi:hypothetical protein